MLENQMQSELQPQANKKMARASKKSLANRLLGKVAKFFTYFIFSKVRKKYKEEVSLSIANYHRTTNT